MSQPRRPAVLSLLSALVVALVVGALGTLAVPPASAAPAAPAAAGSCGCPEEGDYQAPGEPEAPYVAGDGSSASRTPTYRLSATGTGSAQTLVVKRVATGATVATIHTTHTHWGFSPDQRSLVTWRVAAPNLEVALYDLGGSRPATPVLTRSTSTGDGRIGFAPGGGWLSLNYLVSGTTNQAGVLVADTTSGDVAYSTTYSYTVVQGGRPYGVAGWGFSPEGSRFFHAWASGTSTHARLVDLERQRTTWSNTLNGTGFWQFSPCGGKLVTVEQTSGSQMHTTLVDTTTGDVDARRTDPVSGIAFEATPEGHVARIGGVAHRLTANPEPACPDEDAPTWPTTAAVTASEIGRRSVTLSWTAATDDRAVAEYRVYRGSSLVETVPGTSRTAAVTGLQPDTLYTFTVVAADAAGHWATGPDTTARTLSGAPTWPGGWLVVDDVASTTASLRWSRAEDLDGVTAYDVRLDGEIVASLDAGTREHRLTGLTPGSTHAVAVQARNAAGFTTADGPTAGFTTDDFTPLDEATIRGTVYEDVDGDGRRDEGEPGLAVPYGTGFNVRVERLDGSDPGRDWGGWPHEVTGDYEVLDVADGTYLVSLGGFGLGKPGYAMTQPADHQPQVVEIVDGRGWADVDFGVTPGQLPRFGTASISGTVYVDEDGDGVRDAAEEPFREPVPIGCDVRPNLETCDLSFVTRTDESGRYEIGGAVPGQYQVGPFALPAGWYATGGRRAPLLLNGFEAARVDLGVIQGTSTVSGVVFRDDDADGVQDAGEPVRGGTEVCLAYYSGQACQYAGDDGRWSFDRVPFGTHRLTARYLADGWAVTAGSPTTVSVTGPGQDVVTALGLDGPDARIHGVVFDDEDRDGVRDENERGLSSVDLCVSRDGGEPACYLVGGDGEAGAFDLRWLRAGDHAVTLPGLEPTRPDALAVTLGEDEAVRLDVGVDAPTVAPTAPRAPSAGAVSGDTVSLRWTAPADDGGAPVTDYVVEVQHGEETWTFDDGVGADTTAEVDGLQPGLSYAVRVAAVNEAGRGPWSEDAPVTTPVVPGAPTDLVVEAAGPGGLRLTWTPPEDSAGAAPVVDYVVETTSDPDGGTWTTVPDAASSTPELELTGLTGGQERWFRVAAVSRAGRGEFGTPAAGTPQAAAPSAPARLTATAEGRSARLAWIAPTDDGGRPVTRYLVQQASGSGDWTDVTSPGTPATTLVVADLRPGVAHRFRVAAVNDAGVGAWSPTAHLTVAAPPSAPRGLRATATRNRLTLTWSAPVQTYGAGVTDYVVQYAAGSGRWRTVRDGRSTRPRAVVTGLRKGTRYQLRVAAVTSAGQGAWTRPVAARTRR